MGTRCSFHYGELSVDCSSPDEVLATQRVQYLVQNMHRHPRWMLWVRVVLACVATVGVFVSMWLAFQEQYPSWLAFVAVPCFYVCSRMCLRIRDGQMTTQLISALIQAMGEEMFGRRLLRRVSGTCRICRGYIGRDLLGLKGGDR